ncbi:hypothetical protein D1164_12685 [Mariniphaga sediminis]|uniref:Uncharacterized protein n=1 Tax=Mariniphaga sediminis TaxID=1628158 RepID=A0A399D3B0_9BACT|nr:hypothetical protein D1164_12685 [Mariniphaga sediminis]
MFVLAAGEVLNKSENFYFPFFRLTRFCKPCPYHLLQCGILKNSLHNTRSLCLDQFLALLKFTVQYNIEK